MYSSRLLLSSFMLSKEFRHSHSCLRFRQKRSVKMLSNARPLPGLGQLGGGGEPLPVFHCASGVFVKMPVHVQHACRLPQAAVRRGSHGNQRGVPVDSRPDAGACRCKGERETGAGGCDGKHLSFWETQVYNPRFLLRPYGRRYGGVSSQCHAPVRCVALGYYCCVLSLIVRFCGLRQPTLGEQCV